MAVYVDDFRASALVGGLRARWSHLIADDREELHAFAVRLGLKRSWFQDPVVNGKVPAKPGSRAAENWHYDVTDNKRRQAIELGAQPISWRELPAVIDRRIAATTRKACGVEEATCSPEAPSTSKEAKDVKNEDLARPLEHLDRACNVIRNSPLGFHNAELAMSASRIGRLVVDGHLDEAAARSALLDAADVLVTAEHCNCSRESVADVIDASFGRVLRSSSRGDDR
ncbi:DUF4031 domain-containing protein [Amycolatopsis minnesotensis]|uniref:DUF4031 domain-containing protein n=1 Tax=Amycolatopsis minnesotensis TaxID=337894 RepID=A0ABP5DPT7_9PSEU